MTRKQPKTGREEALDALAEAVLEVLDDRPSAGTVGQSATLPASTSRAADVFEPEPATNRFVAAQGSSGVLRRPNADRRTARRVSLEVPIAMRLGNEEFEGTTEDISTSGLFIRTSRLIPAGRRVHLRFDLPHGVMEVTGVVVRFRTPAHDLAGGVGVCFQALSDEHTECLEAFCESADSVNSPTTA